MSCIPICAESTWDCCSKLFDQGKSVQDPRTLKTMRKEKVCQRVC